MGDVGCAISVDPEYPRDGRHRAAQGLVKLGQAVVRSMEKIRCLLIHQRARERETFVLESNGQKYGKEFLPLREQVFAHHLGARVNEHHRAIREMDNQVNQHIEMLQFQYSRRQTFASGEFSGSLTWRTRSLLPRLPKRRGTSCSMIVSRQPRAHTLPQRRT